MQTIEFCRLQLNFKLPSEQTACCRKKFASPEFVRMNLVKFSCAQMKIAVTVHNALQ